jgi:hypothetical protein
MMAFLEGDGDDDDGDKSQEGDERGGYFLQEERANK